MKNSVMTSIRVLLVEDNPGDVLLLKEALRQSKTDFEVEQAPDLASAKLRMEQPPRNEGPRIDVILCDLSLPDSSGIQTFVALHAAAPGVPIIVLSGLNDESLAVETVEAGAQDYLVKGEVDTPLIVRAIRYAIKRVEADNALAEERNLLRSVIDNLPDAIYVKDSEGRYMLDNVAHSKSLKAERMEEVVGRTAFDFFPREVAMRFHADDDAVIKEGTAILGREEAASENNGKKRWLATSKLPLRNRDGQIIGLVGIGRDITARKRAEEEAARYNQELREKNAQHEEDLHMAREIQQAFLPQQYPSFPRKADTAESALHFYARYLPTTAVGGDFFHILPISETAAGVFICDVMGHGVRAALVTAIQRALIEELLDVASEPGTFLTQINRALISILKRTRTPMFATAFYVVADVSSGRMWYSNAGHPPALHIRRDEGVVQALSGLAGCRPGPALGMFERCAYTTYEANLAPRDLIMLFTDGLYEVEAENGDFFDQAALHESVRRHMQLPTGALFDGTLAEVRALRGRQTIYG